MAYWRSEKLKDRIPGDGLVTPFDEKPIAHSTFEMGVVDHAFVTSNPSDKTLVAASDWGLEARGIEPAEGDQARYDWLGLWLLAVTGERHSRNADEENRPGALLNGEQRRG